MSSDTWERTIIGAGQQHEGACVTLIIGGDFARECAAKDPELLGRIIDERARMAAKALRQIVTDKTGVEIP